MGPRSHIGGTFPRAPGLPRCPSESPATSPGVPSALRFPHAGPEPVRGGANHGSRFPPQPPVGPGLVPARPVPPVPPGWTHGRPGGPGPAAPRRGGRLGRRCRAAPGPWQSSGGPRSPPPPPGPAHGRWSGAGPPPSPPAARPRPAPPAPAVATPRRRDRELPGAALRGHRADVGHGGLWSCCVPCLPHCHPRPRCQLAPAAP